MTTTLRLASENRGKRRDAFIEEKKKKKKKELTFWEEEIQPSLL
jgi:hypothetical protein